MVLSFLYNDFVHLDKDKLEHNFLARWRSSIKNALTDTVLCTVISESAFCLAYPSFTQ